MVESSIPLRSTTRFSANRQPRFNVSRMARFRRLGPSRPLYLCLRDAHSVKFPPNLPSVSAADISDHSFGCNPDAGVPA